MTHDLEAIQAWFKSSYGIQAPPDWLAACVEWIQQENGGQLMLPAQLQPMIFEQWLMSDLRELGTTCVPSDLPQQLCTQITGPFALQVESMLDVGFPLYGQLQKVKGTTNFNSEVSADKPLQPAWEPKSSRMMLLKMTDGQTEIQGMEYRPIAALTPDLQPGFKVVIHGCVKCRRGVLMLTADNIQVLGSEVDSLVEANSKTAVLEQAMEANTANSGKHAKKDFSGRYFNKQDSKLGSSSYKKCGVETKAPKMQGSGVYKREPCTSVAPTSSWCRSSVMESSSHQNTVDPEWEDDLDYGGLLSNFDEAMEEESEADIFMASSRPTSNSATSRPPQHNSPFPSSNSSTNFSAARATSFPKCDNTVPSKSFSANVFMTSGTAKGAGNSRVPLQGQAHGEDGGCVPGTGGEEDMWGDDDDFELAQSQMDFEMAQPETDKMSPVIPKQDFHKGPAGNMAKDLKTSAAGQHAHHPRFQLCAGTSIARNSQGLGGGSVPSQHNETSNTQLGSAHKPIVVTSINDNSQHTTEVKYAQNRSFSNGPKASTQVTKARDSVDDERMKPPPPKQLKLTSMLSQVKREVDQDSGGAFDPKAASDQSANERTTTKSTEACITSAGIGDSLLVKKEPLASQVQGLFTSDVSRNGGSGLQKITAPFVVNEGSSPVVTDYQPLKEVQLYRQTDSLNERIFTIKGHITTLTDRLRSGQGEEWSLSCRITDGGTTMDVAIADSVLRHLIGFSAQESITLRQQARKDPKVKDHLTQNLQHCQKALAEFSGLIDLKVHPQSNKVFIVNMVQLAKKER